MFASLALLAAIGSSCPIATPAPVDVSYDGCLILRVRSDAWGLDADRRAVHITTRFTDLVSDSFLAISRGHPVPHPSVKPMGDDWVVVARGAVLATATRDDAHRNNCDCRALARQWARRIDGALHVALTGGKPILGQARSLRASLLARALVPLERMLHRTAEGPASEMLLATPPSPRRGNPSRLSRR